MPNVLKIISRLPPLFWAVLFLSLFLRIYNLEKFAGFSWDQEQLLAVPVKDIIINKKLYLIGPAGKIHLGPLIYYLAVPFFFVFNLHPIAGSVLASFLGITTGVLLYFTVTKYFTQRLALVAFALYATSPLINVNDRTIWNPSLIPLASLGVLAVYLKWIKTKQMTPADLFILATSTALGIQAHFGFIFMLPIHALTIIYMRLLKQLTFQKVLWFLITFVFWFSPLIIFDIRHQAVNVNSLLKFLSSDTANLSLVTVGAKALSIIKANLQMIGALLLDHRAFNLDLIFGTLLVIITIFTRKNINRQLVSIFLIWLLTFSLSFGFYRGNVPEYYLWPVLLPSVLIYAHLFSQLIKRFRLNLTILTLTVMFFLTINTLDVISTSTPDSLYNKLQATRIITQKSQGKPFRLIFDTDFGRNYGFKYIFEYLGSVPSENLSDPAFMIVSPGGRVNSPADKTFGSIAIYYPE